MTFVRAEPEHIDTFFPEKSEQQLVDSLECVGLGGVTHRSANPIVLNCFYFVSYFGVFLSNKIFFHCLCDGWSKVVVMLGVLESCPFTLPQSLPRSPWDSVEPSFKIPGNQGSVMDDGTAQGALVVKTGLGQHTCPLTPFPMLFWPNYVPQNISSTR